MTVEILAGCFNVQYALARFTVKMVVVVKSMPLIPNRLTGQSNFTQPTSLHKPIDRTVDCSQA
jgi:hypothetical protein